MTARPAIRHRARSATVVITRFRRCCRDGCLIVAGRASRPRVRAIRGRANSFWHFGNHRLFRSTTIVRPRHDFPLLSPSHPGISCLPSEYGLLLKCAHQAFYRAYVYVLTGCSCLKCAHKSIWSIRVHVC